MVLITPQKERFCLQLASTLLLLLLLKLSAHSQSAAITIYGVVLDSMTMLPLNRANVYSGEGENRDKPTLLGHTSSEGRFEFLISDTKTQSLTFSFVGYHRKRINIDDGVKTSDRLFLEIHLVPQLVVLDSIEISRKKDVIVNGDTTTYSASNFFHNKYDNLDALIFQIPGIYLNHDGDLIAHGQDVRRISIDGSDFFITNPRELLKIIPAEAVDKIQIIDSKSEQAESSGIDNEEISKTINIILKEDKRTGFFAKIVPQAGTKGLNSAESEMNIFKERDRYSTKFSFNNIIQEWSGLLNNYGGRTIRFAKKPIFLNLDFNYSNEKRKRTNFFLKFDAYNHHTFNREEITNKINVNPDESIITIHKIIGDNLDKGLNLESRIDYRSNSNSLLIIPKILLKGVTSDIQTGQNLIRDDLNVSNVNYQNNMSLLNVTPELRVIYKNTLNDKGEFLSTILNFRSETKQQSSANESNTNNSDHSDILTRSRSSTSNGNHSLLYYLDLNYIRPITKGLNYHAQIFVNSNQNNLKYKTSWKTSSNSKDFLPQLDAIDSLFLDGNSKSSNTNLSIKSTLTYKSKIFEAFVGGSCQMILQRVLMTTQAPLKTRHTVFSPTASFISRPYSFQTLNFSYSLNTLPPNPIFLQHFSDIQDSQNVISGNQALKNERSHQISLTNYLKFNTAQTSLNTSISLKLTDNHISNSISYALKDTIIENIHVNAGARVSRPVNIDGFYFLNINNILSHSISQNRLNGSITLNYSKFRQGYFVNDRLDSLIISATSAQININYFKLPYRVYTSYSISMNNSRSTLMNSTTGVLLHTLSNSLEVKTPLLRLDLISNFNFHISQSTDYYAQRLLLWNLGIKRSFLKKDNLYVALNVFDVFDNSEMLSYNIHNELSTQGQRELLGRFYMLSFTYNFRKFGI